MEKVIWLTGPSESGKSTVGDALAEEIGGMVLHGDEMRESISLELKDDFTREGRRIHNLRVARLAKILSSQTLVIVAVIAPMVKVRDEIDKICAPKWMRIRRALPKRKGHFYEVSPEHRIIDTDLWSVKECVEMIKKFIGYQQGENK